MNDQGFQVDLAREGSREHPVPDFRPKSRVVLLLTTAIVVCLVVGAGFGFWLAKVYRGSQDVAPEVVAVESTVPETGEIMVRARLVTVAIAEAVATVGRGLDDGSTVQAAVAETSPDNQNVPVRISSSGGDVRVRVGGDDAERVGRDVYRVHRTHPVEVEFRPFTSPNEDLEISITPLLNFELVDPYTTED